MLGQNPESCLWWGGSNLEAKNQTPKRARVVTLTLSFLEEDKQGTL